MTNYSQDPAFLDIYAKGLNPHGVTASEISGIPYSEIMEGKGVDDKLDIVYKGGKVTDLGENYRMGEYTLWKNAHVDWGLRPTLKEAAQWRNTWLSLYKGVPQQWKEFIRLAKTYGYAETLAGRRFYIDQWGRNKWKSEASAIMVPVQGSGADMKYLAIAIMRASFEYLRFWGEIHDEVIYLCPNSYDPATECDKVKTVLNNLPYKEAWDYEPTVPFTWTVKWGYDWGTLEEVK